MPASVKGSAPENEDPREDIAFGAPNRGGRRAASAAESHGQARVMRVFFSQTPVRVTHASDLWAAVTLVQGASRGHAGELAKPDACQ